MSKYIHKRKFDTNKCPNIFVKEKLLQTNEYYSGIEHLTVLWKCWNFVHYKVYRGIGVVQNITINGKSLGKASLGKSTDAKDKTDDFLQHFQGGR